MANNVIGLFSSEEVAEQVIRDLRDQGFSERNITHMKGDQDDIEDELEREGVPDDDADYYAEGLRGGGSLVSVRAKDNQVDEAVEIMNRHAETDSIGDASYAAGTPTMGLADTDTVETDTEILGADTLTNESSAAATNTDEARLDVVEERLKVGKREVQRGGMRVRRVVTEQAVEEQVTLRDETIRVDRRPVDRTLDGDNTDLFTEKTYEFTETDEEAVVAKEAHVVEEVVVGKDVENRTETVRATVRRADVEIEEFSADYGKALASDARFEGREWHEFESDARSDYERDNEGGEPWDSIRDTVKSNYDDNRSNR